MQSFKISLIIIVLTISFSVQATFQEVNFPDSSPINDAFTPQVHSLEISLFQVDIIQSNVNLNNNYFESNKQSYELDRAPGIMARDAIGYINSPILANPAPIYLWFGYKTEIPPPFCL
jgi:hypothetical protein